MVEQRVECVEKFLLRAVLVADELDVVDQQHVSGTQPLLERHRVFLPDRLNEPIHEPFGGQVEDAPGRLAATNAPRDGVQKVGLAAPDTAIEVERVERKMVDASDLLRRGVGEFVAFADYEFPEGEAVVERRAEAVQPFVVRAQAQSAVAPRRGPLAGGVRFAVRIRRQAIMNDDAGGLDAWPMIGPKRRDAIRIVRFDPVAEEPRGNAEGDFLAVNVDQSERSQPAREAGVAQFRAKTRPDPLPIGLRALVPRRRAVVRHCRLSFSRRRDPCQHGTLRRQAISKWISQPRPSLRQ